MTFPESEAGATIGLQGIDSQILRLYRLLTVVGEIIAHNRPCSLVGGAVGGFMPTGREAPRVGVVAVVAKTHLKSRYFTFTQRRGTHIPGTTHVAHMVQKQMEISKERYGV